MRFSRIFLVGIFSLILFAAGCAGPESGSLDAAGSQGAKVPDFTLQNLGNEAVSLHGLLKQKKVVLINFWATWCPPCQDEIPGLIGLQSKHQGEAFTVLGVDVGESPLKVKNFVERMGMNYPVVLDRDQAVSDTYRVVGIPTSYLVNSEGKILGMYHAYTEQLVADVENALKSNQ